MDKIVTGIDVPDMRRHRRVSSVKQSMVLPEKVVPMPNDVWEDKFSSSIQSSRSDSDSD